jgi:hypothetical protein
MHLGIIQVRRDIFLALIVTVAVLGNSSARCDDALAESEPAFEAVLTAYAPWPSLTSFSDLGILSENMKQEWQRVPLRDDPRDRMAARLVEDRIEEIRQLGCLVIVDIGHAHSIAVATILAKNGWRPVVKMKEYLGNSTMTLQAVATMKKYAREMLQARQKLTEANPFALIMDLHRSADEHNEFFPLETFPSIDKIKSQFNGCVLRVVERAEAIHFIDMEPEYLKYYAMSGLRLYEYSIDPSHNKTIGGFVGFR